MSTNILSFERVTTRTTAIKIPTVFKYVELRKESPLKPPNFSGRGEYEIKVRGHLDEEWSSWFEELTITTGFDEKGRPITTFAGPIADQAALHGLLAKIRDMNLPLISVTPVAMDDD